jgi:hypothetical protein
MLRKLKYMVMPSWKNAGQNHSKEIDNKSFGWMEQFKYLGKTLTNDNSFQEEIKGRLKSGNACFHSVQNLLSSSLISENMKDKDIQNYNLPVVFYGCDTWSLTLMEEHRLSVFAKRVMRRIFGPRREEVTGE